MNQVSFVIFFFFAPLTSSPPTWRNKKLKADTLGRVEEWNAGGGEEQRNADELASELRGNPESSRSRTAPPPPAALFLRRRLCNNLEKKVDPPHKLDPWEEGADRLHTAVAQAAFLQARARRTGEAVHAA